MEEETIKFLKFVFFCTISPYLLDTLEIFGSFPGWKERTVLCVFTRTRGAVPGAAGCMFGVARAGPGFPPTTTG